MDDLSNYLGATGAITEQNDDYKEHLKALGDTMKSKIKELTDPIGSALMMEGSKGALTTTVDSFASSLKNGNVKKVIDLGKAYKKGGVKGVIKHLTNGNKSKISDLSPDEWNDTRGTIQKALHARGKELTENQRKSITRKFQNEKLDEGDEPDELLRSQQKIYYKIQQ